MAARKSKAGDRPVMDMGGQVAAPEGTAAKTFLDEQADADRGDAKTKHANKGLRTSKDLVATMAKSAAHGLASDSDAVKIACLEELAELGNSVRDGARAALRQMKAENRNVQD